MNKTSIILSQLQHVRASSEEGIWPTHSPAEDLVVYLHDSFWVDSFDHWSFWYAKSQEKHVIK